MKKILYAGVLLTSIGTAQAQTSFAPVTLNEADYNQLMQYINTAPWTTQPIGSVAPLITYFQTMETLALQKQSADTAQKAAQTPAAPPAPIAQPTATPATMPPPTTPPLAAH